MKKIYLTILIIMMLAASACSTTYSTSRTGSSSSNAGLPMATQLVAGSIKLEGTAQQVSAEQAKALLPLWQVYSELITSDTAAQEEIDSLLVQIQETMTSEQMRAITDMHLTRQQALALIQEQGVGISQGAQTGNSSQSSRNFGPPGEGMFMGGPPDGAGGGTTSSRSNSTSQSGTTTVTQAQSVRMNQTLIEKLIVILKAKAGS
jgi:hypothetical protein